MNICSECIEKLQSILYLTMDKMDHKSSNRSSSTLWQTTEQCHLHCSDGTQHLPDWWIPAMTNAWKQMNYASFYPWQTHCNGNYRRVWLFRGPCSVGVKNADRCTQRDRKQLPLIFNNNIELEVTASNLWLSWGMEKPGSNHLNPNPGRQPKEWHQIIFPRKKKFKHANSWKKSYLQSFGMRTACQGDKNEPQLLHSNTKSKCWLSSSLSQQKNI